MPTEQISEAAKLVGDTITARREAKEVAAKEKKESEENVKIDALK